MPNRGRPKTRVKKSEARVLNCPYMGFPRKKCDSVSCMAWEKADVDYGYCKLIETEGI